MLNRLISRLQKNGMVLSASLARKLRIVSRTRLKIYHSIPISPHHRYVRHELPSADRRERIGQRPWPLPELTPYWQAKFRKAEDAEAWQYVLYEYERRN